MIQSAKHYKSQPPHPSSDEKKWRKGEASCFFFLTSSIYAEVVFFAFLLHYHKLCIWVFFLVSQRQNLLSVAFACTLSSCIQSPFFSSFSCSYYGTSEILHSHVDILVDLPVLSTWKLLSIVLSLLDNVVLTLNHSFLHMIKL